MSISITSFSVVSLMAMVPESECRMPTLMVSSALTRPAVNVAAAKLGRAGEPTATRELT